MVNAAHHARVRRARMVAAMIAQPGDHFAAGDEGFTEPRSVRIPFTGTIQDESYAHVAMQAARTRLPNVYDALAAVILSNQRATHDAAYARVIAEAHRADWPILIAAGMIVRAPR